MSSLAGSVSRGPRAAALSLPRVSADTGLTLAVGGILVAIAFTADGGFRLERTTWTEVGLMLLGAALVAAALLSRGVQGRLYGGAMLLGFAALAVFTALSIVWSLSPGDSWLEANRTFAYLAVLAGSLALARLAPQRWAAVLHGVSLGCVAISAWALTTKVFPGTLAAGETYARLREPFGYWNSVGLMAALGVPPVLWLAARRSGHPAANALAWPALGLLFTCLMLSYSRGALLALLIGLGYWFAVVPLRLRAALPLVVAAAASAPVVGWAFARDALSSERIPLAARTDAGHDLGALLVLMVALLLAAGLAVGFLMDSQSLAPRLRRVASRSLLAILVCIPLAAVAAVAAAPGGISGQTSKAWDQLTSRTASTPSNTPNRLTATSSVRARYWGEAMDVFEASPTVGAGAGAFVVARTRYRTDKLAVRHAHGYAVQTLADLGLIGLALSLVATVGWAVAALRVTGIPRRDRRLPFDPERVGLITMTSVVVVFGIHSLIDWTWFVPANAVVALLCAGWVAGRAPLADRLSGAPPASRAPPRLARDPGLLSLRPRGGDRRAGRRDRRELGRAAAGARGARRGRGDRRVLARRLRRRRAQGARGRAPQPADARPALAAGLHRRRPRRQAHRQPGARAGGAAPAGERRGVAAARPLPAVGARGPEERARGLPGRVLPRPRGGALRLRRARGLARAEGQGLSKPSPSGGSRDTRRG